MHIPENALEQFKELYKKDTAIELSDTEAIKQFTKLILTVKIAIENSK